MLRAILAVASMGCSPTRQRPHCRVHKPPRTGFYTQPNIFSPFLNEKDFVILSSKYVVLIGIY